jgi:hypothetical protein
VIHPTTKKKNGIWVVKSSKQLSGDLATFKPSKGGRSSSMVAVGQQEAEDGFGKID